MALRSVEGDGKARIAIVGAATQNGNLVRGELERRRVAGRRVDLYGAAAAEPVISEYAGEARLIQSPDPEELQGHDVVFLCEEGQAADDIARQCADEALIVDLVRAVPGADDRPLIHMGINAPEGAERSGRFAVPHPLAIVLADLLHPLQRGHGLRSATAVVLRPASDFGDDGVEELRQQTVRLLNFTEAPKDVFGGEQLAFNLIPQQLLAGREPGLEERLVREVGRLLCWEEPRLAVRLVTTPIFFGHAVNLRVELERDATVEAVTGTLAAAGSLRTPPDAEYTTPLQASGGDPAETVSDVSEVAEDGLGGVWLWNVIGEAQGASARHAVRLAAALRAL
jgi:aspartate-semialdehyde dehydrogenase